MKRLGILISGRGSNFLAIDAAIRAGQLPAEVAIVISNRADAPGIASARQLGIPAKVIESRGNTRDAHELAVIFALKEKAVDLVCLAGYMRLLSPAFVGEFPRRILNIHPSLLPSFPGIDAQQQALEHGVTFSGCTVHFVDEHLDAGPIIVQRAVPVLPQDDAASLSARILEQEHLAYVEALKRVLAGDFEIVGRRVLPRRGQPQR